MIWYDVVTSYDMSKSKKGLNMHQIYHNNIIRCLWLNCRKRASSTLRLVVHAGNISGILQITQILTIVYSSIIIFTCTLMGLFLKLFLPFIYYAFVLNSIFLTPSSIILYCVSTSKQYCIGGLLCDCKTVIKNEWGWLSWKLPCA